MQDKIMRRLIARDRGLVELDKYSSYNVVNVEALQPSAQDVMTMVPPKFGDCVMLASLWAIQLRDHYSIPAFVFAGDLKIQGKPVFKCKSNVPSPEKGSQITHRTWSGHCWIGVNGYIGDLSIFRTAYSVPEPSLLKSYVVSNFGYGRGALLMKTDDLPAGMKFVPKYVLTNKQEDNQVNAFFHLREQLRL